MFFKSKIEVMSRNELQSKLNTISSTDTVIISFCDPNQQEKLIIDNNSDWKVNDNIFFVQIHDIDIETLQDFGLTFETYFPEVGELAEFIKTAVMKGYNIICQCEYGQSRSAGCAAAIKEYFDKSGIEIFADYRYYPNQLIFNKLLDALKKIRCVGEK